MKPPTTTPSTMIPIEQTIDKLCHIRQQIAELRAVETQYKEAITAYGDAHLASFVDGQFTLSNGVIKIVQNPPRLVHTASGRPLTTAERVELCDGIDDQYVDTKPRLTKIVGRIHGDKQLKQHLASHGISVEQTNRYEAKPYK